MWEPRNPAQTISRCATLRREFVDARKEERSAAFQLDVERLLQVAREAFPFVEAVSWDEASAFVDRLAEHGLGERLFGPRIDRGKFGLLGFVPERHEAPAHGGDLGFAVVSRDDDRHLLAGSDVEARFQRPPRDPEGLEQVTLGECGGRPAITPIFNALRDEDRDVRNSAAKALRRLGERRSLPLPGDVEEGRTAALSNLAVAFDVKKLGGGAYGLVAWTCFWRMIKPVDLPRKSILWCGDCHEPDGTNYVIVFSCHRALRTEIEQRIVANPAYAAVAGSKGVRPMPEGETPSLPQAGEITGSGLYRNHLGSNWALQALESVLNGTTLEQNRGFDAARREVLLRQLQLQEGAPLADPRIQGAFATLQTDADGQLVIEFTLAGDAPSADLSRMTEDELDDYISRQIRVDSHLLYQVDFSDAGVGYRVGAKCQSAKFEGGNTRFSFRVPSGTIPRRT